MRQQQHPYHPATVSGLSPPCCRTATHCLRKGASQAGLGSKAHGQTCTLFYAAADTNRYAMHSPKCRISVHFAYQVIQRFCHFCALDCESRLAAVAVHGGQY